MTSVNWRFLAAWIVLSAFATSAWAQGVLIVTNERRIVLPRPIPRPAPPTMSYKIKELAMNARVTDQVARVQVSQSFVNTGNRQMEVCFVFPLPYDGAVDQLTFLVDGKEYEGQLLPATKARSIYEEFIRRNQDPALLEWMGKGMFKTSVFPVPPGAERKVTLRYNQVLRKDRQLTDFLFPLSTAKYTSHPVEKVSFRVAVETSQKLKSIYSPSHSVNIKRSDENHALVSYEVKNQTPADDFRLFFDTAPTKLGASMLSFRPNVDEDGYFLLLASPQFKWKKKDKQPKTVIIVADRSGSMTGKKIEQAKEAIRFVLNNLEEKDTFNIIAYDSAVESFRPELQRMDENSRKAALGFVEGIYAGGSTNIDGALKSALGMIQDDSRPSYVLFLTDGKPTAGETKELAIAANAKKNNKHHTRVVSFGVGFDVNSRLLDRLTHDNFGRSEYVRPNEDIEDHVSRLYRRISSPVMTKVSIKVEVDNEKVENGKTINRVYPREVHDLFEGEQLVLTGRYRLPGNAKVVIRGTVGDSKQKFDFPAKLIKGSPDESYGFVEKLWAVRRIGEIIDELDLKGKNKELIEELLALSTKHGVLTPYTSFLADDRATAPLNSSANVDATRMRLENLRLAEGRDAFFQRAQKKVLQGNASASQSAIRRALQSGGGIAGIGGGGAGFGSSRGAGQAAAKNRPGSVPGAALGGFAGEAAADDSGVLGIGNEALYRRGKVWIASNAKDVDLVKDKAKMTEVKRFSSDYFKLVADNTSAENSLLSRQQAGEELLIRLRGKLYLIK